MPNENRPTGLSPVKTLTGAPFCGQANLYVIPAADTNAYAIGDPVISGGSANSNGVPTVTIAIATGPIRGVIVGIGTQEGLIANPSNLDQTIRTAGSKSIDYFVMVVDDPNTLFEVQEVGDGTPFAAADIGLNAALSVGTNNGFFSGWQLSNSGAAVTATIQVRLMGLVRRPDNAFGAYAKHLVLINAHELRVGSVGR